MFRSTSMILLFIFAAVGGVNQIAVGKSDGFPTYTETNALLNRILIDCHQLMRSQSIGRSFEGRDIDAYIINDLDSPEKKRNVLITSMMHPREPIGLLITLNLMRTICDMHVADQSIANVLKYITFYLVPILNPDGFAFSDSNKLLNIRKNRRPGCDDPLKSGVDLNRNFGYHWEFNSDPCSEEFAGGFPFSEPETQALKALTEEISFYTALNFHSYGDILTHPFNFGKEDLPETHRQFYDEVKTIFGFERVGPAHQVLGYTTTGESDDWLYAKRGILSMSPEIGPEQSGFYPPQEIAKKLVSDNLSRIFSIAELISNKLSASIIEKDGLRYAAISNRSKRDSQELFLGIEGECSWNKIDLNESMALISGGILIRELGSLPGESERSYPLPCIDTVKVCIKDLADCSCIGTVNTDVCSRLDDWLLASAILTSDIPILSSPIYKITIISIVLLSSALLCLSRLIKSNIYKGFHSLK